MPIGYGPIGSLNGNPHLELERELTLIINIERKSIRPQCVEPINLHYARKSRLLRVLACQLAMGPLAIFYICLVMIYVQKLKKI